MHQSDTFFHRRTNVSTTCKQRIILVYHTWVKCSIHNYAYQLNWQILDLYLYFIFESELFYVKSQVGKPQHGTYLNRGNSQWNSYAIRKKQEILKDNVKKKNQRQVASWGLEFTADNLDKKIKGCFILTNYYMWSDNVTAITAKQKSLRMKWSCWKRVFPPMCGAASHRDWRTKHKHSVLLSMRTHTHTHKHTHIPRY